MHIIFVYRCLANVNGDEGLLGGVASIIATVGGFGALVRWLLKNATGPIAAGLEVVTKKVADHDDAIARSVELGNSTNIKVARIEGFLSANGSNKLPEVEPTLEKPDDNGQITEEPLIPKGD